MITVDGVAHAVAAGDALVVPAGATRRLANPHTEPFEAIAVRPVGARVTRAGAAPFVPPWAAQPGLSAAGRRPGWTARSRRSPRPR